MKRKDFIKLSAVSGAGMVMAGSFPGVVKAGFGKEKIRVAVMGGRSRAGALALSFAKASGSEVVSVYDVDRRPLDGLAKEIESIQGKAPATGTDFRYALEDPAVDALVIGAPDHWHTPATVMALSAGKHVYVEKPGSHNPYEAELIVQAQQRYGGMVQMGNQQRSAPESIEAIRLIHEGLIGSVHYAKAFYSMARNPIGRGQIADVPEWLDYELWQGPAPRTPYRDNVIHYNWHWFKKWGTGELLNNGTHEVDICRWALDVQHPVRVTSHGGRFFYDDDWEFFDTQNVTFDFSGKKAINWEGFSANGFQFFNRGRGSVIYGSDGTMLIDREGFIAYDRSNQEIRRSLRQDDAERDQLDTVGAGPLTDLHIQNFIDGIVNGARLTAPIEDGQKSVHMLHLGNISQYVERSLKINERTGRIVGDSEAMSYWKRPYEPGWEPRI
ncbi:Gfo/Idh/MocA family oxidoreductase [Balneolaceae bacterium ANBcel3]|nr:Gfo/Idh/MocA family oxidoreductase [Balneolaceae bacterium ANBcel3]